MRGGRTRYIQTIEKNEKCSLEGDTAVRSANTEGVTGKDPFVDKDGEQTRCNVGTERNQRDGGEQRGESNTFDRRQNKN